MSERPSIDPRKLLGLPEFESPILSNPETGEPESAFMPLPGEEVPPADILAETFPPRGKEGMALPETIDGVKALFGSLHSLYVRSPERTRGALRIYAIALDRQGNKLDPAVNRYLRTYEELDIELDDSEGFFGVMTEMFGKTPGKNNGKPAPDLYERLGEHFYADPKTIGIFNFFATSAESEGYIRKNWQQDKLGLLYPPLARRIREGHKESPDDTGSWFVRAVQRIEQLQDELVASSGEPAPAGGLPGMPGVYSVIEGMVDAPFARIGSEDRDMQVYDYQGLRRMCAQLTASSIAGEPYAEAAAKVAADVSRSVSERLLEQKIITPVGSKELEVSRVAALSVVNYALEEIDGHTTTYEAFKTSLYKRLNADPKRHIIDREIFTVQSPLVVGPNVNFSLSVRRRQPSV